MRSMFLTGFVTAAVLAAAVLIVAPADATAGSARRCAYGYHWAPGHIGYHGAYVRGHCVRDRRPEYQ